MRLSVSRYSLICLHRHRARVRRDESGEDIFLGCHRHKPVRTDKLHPGVSRASSVSAVPYARHARIEV